MIRIVYIVSTLKRSGPTNQLFNLIKYLDRNIYEPHIITLSPEYIDTRWADFEAIGVILHGLNLSRIAGVFRASKKIALLMQDIRPHLIHSQGFRGDVFSSSCRLKIPKICTIRNYPQVDYSLTYGILQAKYMVWRHVTGMRKLSMCVGVSRTVSKNLNTLFLIDNVLTIPNGVDTEIYYPIDVKQKRTLRKRLSLPVFGNLWVVSGHLSIRKDPLYIIDLWKKRFYQDIDNHLLVLGDGELEKQCHEKSKGILNIHILGRVENVCEFLRAGDYFISASHAEGLPNAVLEAVACGLPVLLSDIEPHKEILKVASSFGYLFQAGKDDSFLRAIDCMLKDSREKLQQQTAAIVSEHLSAKVMSQRYQKLYSESIRL